MDEKRTRVNEYIPIIIAFILLIILIGGSLFIYYSSIAPMNTTTTTDKNIAQFSQLIKEDTISGSGKEAKTGSKVKVNYTGKLPDGTIFDSSLNPGRTPFEFTLGEGNVIQGWDQGLIGMKEGGKRTLKIPSSLGYGSRGAGSAIKPNYDLIFEVELLSVSE